MSPQRSQPTSASSPIEELHSLLIGQSLAEGANLHLSQDDGQIQIHIMAVDLGRLGILLATPSDPAEVHDPSSLSCRITPGSNDGSRGRWRYELIAGRYPTSREIVLSAKVQLPVTDLPDVLARLRRRS